MAVIPKLCSTVDSWGHPATTIESEIRRPLSQKKSDSGFLMLIGRVPVRQYAEAWVSI